MKKSITIAIVAALVIGAFFATVFVVRYCRPTLSYLPDELTSISYNNYKSTEQSNTIDYQGDRFAWLRRGIFSPKLTIVDGEGNYQYLNGIGPSFQLCGDFVVHMKNEYLFIRNIRDDSSTVLARDVLDFIACNDKVYYRTRSDWEKGLSPQLFVYDLSKKEKECIHREVFYFVVRQGKLFFVDGANILFEVSPDDLSMKKVADLSLDFFASSELMPQGKNWLIYESVNTWRVFDLNQDKWISDFYLGSGTYIDKKLPYICDEKNIFISLKMVRLNDPKAIEVYNEQNGLWRVDPLTSEKERITSQTFERLYLYEGDRLFGSNGNRVYQIDIETKQITEITP